MQLSTRHNIINCMQLAEAFEAIPWRCQFIGQLGDFDDYASTIRTKLSQLEQLYQQIGKLTKLEYLDLQALTTADRFPWKPAYYGHNSSRHADH
ncbi:hypothetical protein BGX23_006675 [Mortierella sp. AD031]|nr:hypothetical protein BGX23_006675 [Mortierella sp. AD031]